MKNKKLFRMDEIFHIKKGKRLTKVDMIKGELNYIGAISENNGVRQKINAPKQFDGNCITVNYNGSVGEAFYQEQAFWASDDVNVLILKDYLLNKKIAMYLITIIKANQYRFSYGRKWTKEKMSETEILLPVDAEGNPDWKAMETFISQLRISPITTGKKYSKQDIDMNTWKELQIGEIFKVTRGKRIVKNIDYFNQENSIYKYPVITSTTQNNSVDGFYDRTNCKSNTIVCGGEASGMFATYQKSDCWVMDRARIFIPISENVIVNKYTACFLITIMKKHQYKFSYGRSANPDVIMNLNIKLPVDSSNNPNWFYMENYIKSLPYSDRI